MPQLQNHIQHYTADAELFDYFVEASPLESDGSRRLHEAVLRAAALPGTGMVLDAGSGNGWLAASSMDREVRIVSVDIGLRNLQEIRRRVPGALTVRADLARLPFRTGCFTRIVSAEVLEHTNDPAAVMRELAMTLAPGGRIVISTPYRENIRLSLCIHCNRPTPVNAHLHAFDERAHRALFQSCGLDVLRERRLFSKVFLMSRISYAFRFLPFSIWSFIDRCFLALSGNASMLISAGQPSRTRALPTEPSSFNPVDTR